jgi:HK97 family phage prohead protease
MIKLFSTDDFRAAAKDGTSTDGTVFRFATGEPKNVEGAARTKRFVFSDASIDHSNDSIDPKGWDLSVFNRNPVALFSHMSWDPPIGRASNVSVENKQLAGDIEFASAEVYPFADTIYQLVDGGFLNATSVGFKPKEWVFSADKDRPYGIDFKKQLLLEISVCPVPCNPNALGEARSMGINTAPLVEWAEKVLDTGDIIFMPKAAVETLRSQAGAREKRFYIAAPKSLSADVAEKVRDAVKRWQNDPTEVLVLEQGVTLRTVGEEPVVHTGEPRDTPLPDDIEPGSEVDGNAQNKAGRRISAATKAKIKAALDHHAAAVGRLDEAGKCLKEMSDDAEEEPGDEDDDEVVEMAVPPVEVPDNSTPEERRVKEARALRESLPAID